MNVERTVNRPLFNNRVDWYLLFSIVYEIIVNKFVLNCVSFFFEDYTNIRRLNFFCRC